MRTSSKKSKINLKFPVPVQCGARFRSYYVHSIGANGTKAQQPTNYSWLEINKHSTGNVLSSSSLGEEGVEGVITTSDRLVTGHLSIRLDSMLQTVQFPTGITDLDSSLSDVDRDALALQ